MASVVDPENPSLQRMSFVGDIQIHVPDNKSDAKLYFDLPGENDTILLPSIVDRIHNNHAIAGCVADICVEDFAAMRGIATQMRNHAIAQIKQQHPQLEYLIAEIFCIRAIEVDGETTPIDALNNGRSLNAHLKPPIDKKNELETDWAWTRHEDRIPLTSPYENIALICDWYACVHHLYGRSKEITQSQMPGEMSL